MMNNKKIEVNIQTNNKCFSICGEDGIPMGSRQKSTYHHDGPLGLITLL